MQKIIPHIWFADNAEEASEFYTELFADGEILNTTHYLEAGQEIHGQEPGSVLTVDFSIEGTRLTALNGGSAFRSNPSISFIVHRESKGDIDRLWAALIDGGEELMPLAAYPFSKYYGWVQDRFGVSWQLILPDEAGDWRPSFVPSLMFVTDAGKAAEDAVNFYTSIFDDAEIGNIARYPAGQEPNQEGAIMYSDFTLAGQWFAAMDASASQHTFAFSEGVSLLVECEDQEEIDYYWEKLSADPAAEQCGWLKDKFSVSWQVVPAELDKLIADDDTEAANRVMNAFFSMGKINIGKLREAYNKSTS